MTPLSNLSLLPASSALAGASPQPVADGAAFALLLPIGVTPGAMRQADAESGKGLPAAVQEDDDLAGGAAMAWFAPPLWDAARPPIAAPVSGEHPVAVPVADSSVAAAPATMPVGTVSAPVPSFDNVGTRSATRGASSAAVPTETIAHPMTTGATPSLLMVDGSMLPVGATAGVASPMTSDQPFPTVVPAGAAPVGPGGGARAVPSRSQPKTATTVIASSRSDQPIVETDPLASRHDSPDTVVGSARGAEAAHVPVPVPARNGASVTPQSLEATGIEIAAAAPKTRTVLGDDTEHAAVVAPTTGEAPRKAELPGKPRRAIASVTVPAGQSQPAAPPLVIPAGQLAPQNATDVAPRGRHVDVVPPIAVSIEAAPIRKAPASVGEAVKADRQIAASPVAPAADAAGQEPAGLVASANADNQLPLAVAPQAPDQRAPVIAPAPMRPGADIAPPLPLDSVPASDAILLPVEGTQAAPQSGVLVRPAAKDLSVAATPAPAPAMLVQPAAEPAPVARIAPAAQIFAAAMNQMFRDERRAETADPASIVVGAVGELGLAAAGPAEAVRHAAIDMTREAWPAKMIERIEMIRDALNATDTSIRLVPDKLGAIDVSLRQDGDKVQVQFTAQQAETRQLLADAQPKLAELAEAKGLKLSAQFGDASGGSQPQHQQRAPAGAQTTNLRPGRGASNDDAGALADERIA